jgi:hypothetical protein
MREEVEGIERRLDNGCWDLTVFIEPLIRRVRGEASRHFQYD